MATWTIYTSNPADTANQTGTGQAALVDTGIRVDDTVTNDKAGGPVTYSGSTFTIQIGKWMAHLQRVDKSGRLWYASSDGLATKVGANF